jgi:hypothetical protein
MWICVRFGGRIEPALVGARETEDQYPVNRLHF